MKIILLLGCLTCLFACRPCKELTQTVRLTDTIYTPTVQTDTIFKSHLNDTLTLIKERLKVQIIRHHDTLLVHGECNGDTIIKNHTVIVRQPVRIIKEKQSFNLLFKWWFWLLICVVLLSVKLR